MVGLAPDRGSRISMPAPPVARSSCGSLVSRRRPLARLSMGATGSSKPERRLRRDMPSAWRMVRPDGPLRYKSPRKNCPWVKLGFEAMVSEPILRARLDDVSRVRSVKARRSPLAAAWVAWLRTWRVLRITASTIVNRTAKGTSNNSRRPNFPRRLKGAGISSRAQTPLSPKTLKAKWTQLSTLPDVAVSKDARAT